MENVSSVRPSRKFLEKKGKSKKVSPFSRLERSERFACHLHVSCSLHQFQVQGKKKKETVTASSQNKMASLEPSLRYQCTGFFWLPPPNDQRHTGKTVQRYSSYRKHSARKPLWKTTNSCRVIPVQCQVLALVWFMANSEVMRSVSDRFNVTLSSLMWSIWDNSYLNCGCRWKWRMIIAVNFPI